MKLVLSLLACFVSASVVQADAPPKALSFERDIQPLLKARCFHCHGEEAELQGGLDVRLKRLLVKGGDSGPAIVPKNAADSYLMARVRSGEMPPPDAGKPLTKTEIQTLSRWIDEGAKTTHPEPESLPKGMLITQADREYWAFQPVKRPVLPTVSKPGDVTNSIDHFILHRLEEQGLGFSPLADRRTLIRRLAFDLWGLPPTPEEVKAFENDPSPLAWEHLVDRMLASPRYGERWGRHWLDVAGYADSEGATDDDAERKWAWKYRDYVIQSFNRNQPFDEFLVEQLAGDELVALPAKNWDEEQTRKLVATGFLRMAPDGTASANIDKPTAQNQVIADSLEIVTGALLGLTVKCAQCHEHRYDPISQADYYQLRAVFEPAWNWKQWKVPNSRLIPLLSDADEKKSAALEQDAQKIDKKRTARQTELIEKVFQQQMQKVPEADRESIVQARNLAVKDRTPEQTALLRKYPMTNVTAGSLYLYDRKAADELKKLAADAKAIRDRKPKRQFVRALTENPGTAPKTFLFHRGDHEQPHESLKPAVLSILSPYANDLAMPVNNPDVKTTGRRLAYANWLTSGRHPLVARVWVNRVWHHHFGRGIVSTPGDFGRLGERPSHPMLLDWLAAEFVESGWDLKALHRLILNSRTYRQALRTDDKHQEIDPDNLLFGGARLRRVEAEPLRDSILAVAGTLNEKRFGPAVPVMADRVGQWVIGIENLNAGRPGPVIAMKGEEFRRSVYVQVRRSRPLAVLDTFDAPRMEPHCEARAESTVAPQSLMLMNGTFTLAQSEHFAQRLLKEAGDSAEQQIRRAWNLVYCRDPEPAELQSAVAFLEQQTDILAKKSSQEKSPAHKALASFCQVLLGSNEFLYID